MNKLSIKILVFTMCLLSISYAIFAVLTAVATYTNDKSASTSVEASSITTEEISVDTFEDATENEDTVTTTGILELDGSIYYYTNYGKKLTNAWKTVNGVTYYFGITGKAHTGLYNIDGNTYYFYSNGAMAENSFKTVHGNRYYFGEDGAAYADGIHEIDGCMYFFDAAGVLQTSTWKFYNCKMYYLCGDGKVATGFKVISGNRYYFNEDGIKQVSTIVGDSETGYYYVDTTGVVCTDEATQAAATWLMENTDSTMTRAEKLKAAFDYLWKKMKYKRTYGIPGAEDFTDYAAEMLTTKEGNCFKYAASFAVFAKILGYETRVVVGDTISYSGDWTSHGWTEVKVDGSWYLCDPDLQMNYPNINAYMIKWSKWPYRCQVDTKYYLTTMNGTLIWSEVS